MYTKLRKMENKRVLTTGRRAAKKDSANNSSNDAKKKRKGNEDTNVLRTRSGRTRTATNFNKTATTSRKKTTNVTISKTISNEADALNVTKEACLNVTEQNVKSETKNLTNDPDNKVCHLFIAII